MKGEIKTDKSYGMIGIAHYQGGEREFFGSDALWTGGIQLTIKQGQVERDLNRDWYSGQNTICQVRMTSVQFAELLTHTNMGDGVPCTIEFTQADGYIKYKPMERIVEKLEGDIDKEVERTDNSYKDAVKLITELMANKKLSRTAGEELLNTLKPLNTKGTFLKECMKKEMAKVVNEAKASLRNFVEDGNLLMDVNNTLSLTNGEE